MKKKKIISIFLLACFLFPFSNSAAYANKSNFSMQPLDSESKQPQSGFYDLTVVPNEKKIVTIRVINGESKNTKVNVEANNATTNDNGITSYLRQDKKEQDNTLKIPFSEIATVEQENPIIIPANSSVDVDVVVQIPKEPFQGIILGGIRVTSEDNKEKDGEKAAVTSEIAYTVGVVLKENPDKIQPDIKLLGVKTEQRNGRNYISTNLQNAAQTIVKNLEVVTRVYKQGGKDILYEASNNTMRMAPNSNFNFGISLEDQPFKSGDYIMKVSGKADGTDFSFEKDFKITSKEADEWNKNAVYVEESFHFNVGYLLMIIVPVSVIGLFLFWFVKKRGK